MLFTLFIPPGDSSFVTARVRFTVNGQSESAGTGIKVPRSRWDNKAQRISTRNAGRERHLFDELNAQLTQIQTKLQSTFTSQVNQKSEMNKSVIKRVLNGGFIVKADFSGVLVSEVFDEFIKAKKLEDKKENTLKTYANSARLFKEYNPRQFAKTFTQRDFASFLAYLKEQGKEPSYRHLVATHFKTVFKWAFDNDLIESQHFLKFKKPNVKSDTQVIYLTKDELEHFLSAQVTGKYKEAQEMFLFQCLTSIRFSDLNKVKPEAIEGGSLLFAPQKTGNFLKIPLSDRAKEIVAKYPDGFPKVAHCVYQDRIRVVAKLAKINTLILTKKNINGQKVPSYIEKWQCIGTHTGRRTKICMDISDGIPPHLVKKITGHRDIRTLQRYVEISNEEVERRYQKQFEAQNLEKELKPQIEKANELRLKLAKNGIYPNLSEDKDIFKMEIDEIRFRSISKHIDNLLKRAKAQDKNEVSIV
jgi:site-specific recombinase XerD